MILTNYFIGFIEDSAGHFSIPRLISGLKGCTDFVGYPTGLCQNLFVNNQPLIFIPAFLLAKLVDPTLAYNLIVLGGTGLNFFFAFRFFKRLFGRFIALLLASIFLFSPYLAYQSRAHFDLIQVWPVVWFLDTLFFSKSRHKAVFLGLLLTLITGISNYLGYFTILFTAVYLAFALLMSAGKVSIVKKYYREVIKGTVVFALSSSLFIAPYIKSNYLSPKVRIEESVDDKAANRPFEDFITFSSRPWYYLLPSVDNPFFGGLSQNLLDKLSSGGNYLTQNYFKAEHSASYLGWVNLVLVLIGVLGRRASQQFEESGSGAGPRDESAVKSAPALNLPTLLITIIGLIILTMPPSITVSGVTVVTPSYLLFKFFPMFRVLARAGVLILFLTLIFTGYGYRALIKRGTPRLILLTLALFSVAEFLIPLKITHVGTPPKVYAHIGATDPLKSPMVVYPYNKTNEALFWMTTHKQPLINPRSYENKPTNFVSEDFTNLLNTDRGLAKAQLLGAKYLVYFYEDDGGKSADFFSQTDLLTRIAQFNETDVEERQALGLVRVVEAGSAVSNSAVLYKFR